MASSRPINSLPIENNPQLSGYTIYEDGVKTSIISFETLKSIVSGDTTYVEGIVSGETQNRISGDTYLYNLITGETQNRIESDNTKFNNSGGTINGDVTINEGIIYGNGQGLSGLTIGNAEDGTYDDGIFTDFNPQTKIGVAVDRFNEMFKLLAPVPPSPWNMATSFNNTSTSYLAKQLGTNDIVSITTNVSPIFQVGIPENGLGEYDNGILSAYINNNLVDSIDLSVNDSKTTGIIRYQTGDPYLNQSGKSGFWIGILSASLNLTGLTPSTSIYNVTFSHSINGDLTGSVYIDKVNTPIVSNINCTLPIMSSYVSGVKTLITGQMVEDISFSLENSVSHFYPIGNIWTLNQNILYQQSGGFSSIPSMIGEIININNVSSSIIGDVYSENFNFSIKSINTIGQYSIDHQFINGNIRVDTVSNENERLTSGYGEYPEDFGLTFQSNLNLGDIYINELQLINGYYRWPYGNYSSYDSVDYSNISNGDLIGDKNYRWATFKVGSKVTPVNNITITIPNATIGTSWGSIKMFVKIGSSGWLDASTDFFSGSSSAPYNNGDPVLYIAGSAPYYIRNCTFGTVARSGDVYVRIGVKSTDTSFAFKKPIMINN